MKAKLLVWVPGLIMLASTVTCNSEAVRVTFDYVLKKAIKRTQAPFRSPTQDLPDVLKNLTYDQYREIEFRHEKALWLAEDLPFRVEFFLPRLHL